MRDKQMTRYIWLAFTDKYGFITIDGEYSCDYVQSLLKLYGCKNYELHLADNDTIMFFLSNYLEDCLQLEYVKE